MRPAVPDASMERTAARQHRKAVRALVSIISAKDADSILSTGAMAKPAGKMDGSPQIGNAGIEGIDLGRIGEVDIVAPA